jgi:hypothetical protein
MKRTYRFVEQYGTARCTTEAGQALEVPIFAGILKHPSADQLAKLLTDPIVVRKYSVEALRRAPWKALRRFPRAWLLTCLGRAEIPEARRKALEFMLGVRATARRSRSPPAPSRGGRRPRI